MENEQNVSQSIAAPTVAVSDMGADKISDEKLFELCRQYGRNALEWRRKFLGLLPEVAKRRLYEKHGFTSIFEFGFKLAGVSELQIRRILNMEEKFRDKKILHKMLINGEISANKLYKIAPIATVENQRVLAQQIKILPCKTLETLARDEKILAKSNLQIDHVVATNVQSSELKLSSEVQQRLFKLQKKGININELLTEFLDRREREVAEEKEEIAKKITVDPKTRHVPAKIQKIIKKEFGTKCAVPTCNKPAEHIHHTLPFALSQNHDPRYLMPLCKEHHVIAHSIDQKFHAVRQMVT